MTVDEYAALIERCSLRRYPRITVAVGFCMYIKRQVIEEVGCLMRKRSGGVMGRKMISATAVSRWVTAM